MITYDKIFIISWLAFILVWGFSALNVKKDVRGGFSKFWRSFWLIRIFAAAVLIFLAIRIAAGTAHYTNRSLFISHNIFMPPLVIDWLGAILSVLGIGFAIWARFHLGRNWSPRPAVKEQHELITSGPYRYVRHPIYTGMLLAVLGIALTGTIFGLIVLVFACAVFLARIGREEKIMLELFPGQYPGYQSRTKRLVPFVW